METDLKNLQRIDDIARKIKIAFNYMNVAKKNRIVTWRQDFYELLYLFARSCGVKIGKKSFSYMGLINKIGRKNQKRDFILWNRI